MKVSDMAGRWLGWISVVAGLVGFFFIHFILGIVAIVCGGVGFFSPQRALSSVGIVAGIIALLIGFGVIPT